MRFTGLARGWAFALIYFLSSTGAVLAAPEIGLEDSQASHRPACKHSHQAVRREWGDLSKWQRKEYIRSVKCMLQKPSRIPAGRGPGATYRLHDFIATHINETVHIHNSGIFLSWHRHFAWLWERALQQECNYHGTLPYWNWPLWADDLSHSPYFDGSDTSLSGDGEHNASAPAIVFKTPLPNSPANGGGPVTTGPFANLIAPFRNFAASEATAMNGTVPFDALHSNPHPFRRDLNNYIASTWLTQEIVDYGIYQIQNISVLQDWFSGDFPNNIPGPHSAGHLSIGTDMGDFFASPIDPMFYLHHAMVDLVWTKWQAQDPRKRQYALSGGSTTQNVPPSPDVTVDDYLHFGYLDKPQRIGDVMDVSKGKYCYRYDY